MDQQVTLGQFKRDACPRSPVQSRGDDAGNFNFPTGHPHGVLHRRGRLRNLSTDNELCLVRSLDVTPGDARQRDFAGGGRSFRENPGTGCDVDSSHVVRLPASNLERAGAENGDDLRFASDFASRGCRDGDGSFLVGNSLVAEQVEADRSGLGDRRAEEDPQLARIRFLIQFPARQVRPGDPADAQLIRHVERQIGDRPLGNSHGHQRGLSDAGVFDRHCRFRVDLNDCVDRSPHFRWSPGNCQSRPLRCRNGNGLGGRGALATFDEPVQTA